MSFNRVTLLGHIGQDPEILATQDGRRLAQLSLATSESWTDKRSGEKREQTEWHRIVVFNEHLVGIIEKYVHKGSKILVEGALQTRKWTDRDGNDRYSTEIVLSAFNGTLKLEGGPRDGRSDSGDTDSAAPPPRATRDELDDEIPF